MRLGTSGELHSYQIPQLFQQYFIPSTHTKRPLQLSVRMKVHARIILYSFSPGAIFVAVCYGEAYGLISPIWVRLDINGFAHSLTLGVDVSKLAGNRACDVNNIGSAGRPSLTAGSPCSLDVRVGYESPFAFLFDDFDPLGYFPARPLV